MTTADGHQSEEREFFVEIPVEWYRGGEERVFAVDGDGWHSVEIESPDEMVSDPKQIPLKYQTSRGPDLGSYHQLDWSFLVSNEGDAMCCPSGGEVSGTYKIVQGPRTESADVEDGCRNRQIYGIDAAEREQGR